MANLVSSHVRLSLFCFVTSNKINKLLTSFLPATDRCGNVASILELDEHLGQEYKVFQHAPLVCIPLFSESSYFGPYSRHTCHPTIHGSSSCLPFASFAVSSFPICHPIVNGTCLFQFLPGCAINTCKTSSCRLLLITPYRSSKKTSF